jgi:hypothetical protein
MTESPMDLPTPHKYARLVCIFSKWCRLLACEYFRGASYAPNTATIFWFEDAMEANDNSHLEYFSIYSNLAPSKSLAKKQARRIRKMHLIDCLGKLGLEPKAASSSNVERNTKFGHCAETLALTRYVVRISVERPSAPQRLSNMLSTQQVTKPSKQRKKFTLRHTKPCVVKVRRVNLNPPA